MIKKKKPHLLVVGGTGFIGYHLAKKSLKKGWHVTSISLHPPKKIRYLQKVKYIICDITKKKLLKKKYINLLIVIIFHMYMILRLSGVIGGK